MTSSNFLDINVWLALHHQIHDHHLAAMRWFDSLDEDAVLVFSRQTQLGFFRLMATRAVLGNEVLTQRQCWNIYDRWIDSGKAYMAEEPTGVELEMRSQASANSVSPKVWADAYLAAFAVAGRLTLVTFDRALATKAQGAVLLA